jgi:hypothetical protein
MRLIVFLNQLGILLVRRVIPMKCITMSSYLSLCAQHERTTPGIVSEALRKPSSHTLPSSVDSSSMVCLPTLVMTTSRAAGMAKSKQGYNLLNCDPIEAVSDLSILYTALTACHRIQTFLGP